MKVIFYILLILTSLKGMSQAKDATSTYVFQSGEKAMYDIHYNWGFIWLTAGWASFETTINNDTILFEGKGGTLPSYDWIFKVRDVYQSKVKFETFEPIWFMRNTSEGKNKVHNEYTFDQENNQIYTWINNSDFSNKRDTLSMPMGTFDVLTATYYCRNIDFSVLKVNDTVPFKTIIDNEIHELHIRYLGKEKVKLKNGNAYYCIKFNILLVEGTIFRGGEQMTIWVTNDKNRIPVKINAKILVGSVQANLKRIENNKWPVKVIVE